MKALIVFHAPHAFTRWESSWHSLYRLEM